MNIEQFDDKTRARFQDLAREVQAAREHGGNHGIVLATAIDAMKRINKRAAVPDDLERFEVPQTHGPILEFTGRLLAETEFTTERSDPLRISFEIYETQGGALVAVSSTEPVDREGFEVVRATVVERQDDALAMRCAVMQHFDFHPRARNMAKKLGWSLRVEVD